MAEQPVIRVEVEEEDSRTEVQQGGVAAQTQLQQQPQQSSPSLPARGILRKRDRKEDP